MVKDTTQPKQVLYPPVVIAHITKEVTDLFAPRMTGKEEIQMHYSAQMNSYPHMGTVLSLITAFAFRYLLAGPSQKHPLNIRIFITNIGGK